MGYSGYTRDRSSQHACFIYSLCHFFLLSILSLFLLFTHGTLVHAIVHAHIYLGGQLPVMPLFSGSSSYSMIVLIFLGL